MSKEVPNYIAVEASQFELENPEGWIGVAGIAHIVETVKRSVPDADLVIVVFHELSE